MLDMLDTTLEFLSRFSWFGTTHVVVCSEANDEREREQERRKCSLKILRTSLHERDASGRYTFHIAKRRYNQNQSLILSSKVEVEVPFSNTKSPYGSLMHGWGRCEVGLMFAEVLGIEDPTEWGRQVGKNSTEQHRQFT
jgi:hypothetical protein